MIPVCRGLRLFWLVFVLATAALPAGAQQEFVLPLPVAADFHGILGATSDKVQLYSYQGRNTIFLVDFPDLLAQGRMFNRLVALIERIGAPRERVLSNEELAQFIRVTGRTAANFAYGNDFLVGELVVFFNLADLGNITLTAEEMALRQFLLDQQLMVMRTGFYQAVRPRTVVLSLPQVRAAADALPAVTTLARQTILAHELAHAEYYTNRNYANFCRHFWHRTMSEAERSAFRNFLSRGGYNPDNQEMMINEMQAYLLHTPDPGAFSAQRVGLTEAQLNALRQKFRAGFPEMTYVGW